VFEHHHRASAARDDGSAPTEPVPQRRVRPQQAVLGVQAKGLNLIECSAIQPGGPVPSFFALDQNYVHIFQATLL
jgi:hypothetical protein